MADNYLEKKFEEYNANRGKRPQTKRTTTLPKAGTIQMKFPPRRVFVTGGAKGIGRAIVARFCSAGCRVAFCDIDSRAGQSTAEATGSRFYPVDVTDASALRHAVESVIALWGDLDILVNNVGICKFEPLESLSLDAFDKTVATNLRPVIITAQAMARHRANLVEPSTYGRIINISSTRHIMSEPDSEAYAATKGGVAALTHALAASLAKYHITVNSISPGWIETGNYDTLRAVDHEQHMSRRVGRPDDIASACLYLSMPESDFITATDIVVDGGMTHKMIYEE